jgi:uncharacterized phage-associated protein
MDFEFNERRATQAAAFLLKKSGGRQNYTWLLKVLYLADRQALAEVGSPIAGAKFCNMTNGPLASDVYNCIKREQWPACEYWQRHISKDRYDVTLEGEPGDGELSDYDVELLEALYEEHKGRSYSRMVDVVHKLKEWHDPGEGRSERLLPEDIMRAAGAEEEEIAEVSTRSDYFAQVARHLG